MEKRHGEEGEAHPMIGQNVMTPAKWNYYNRVGFKTFLLVARIVIKIFYFCAVPMLNVQETLRSIRSYSLDSEIIFSLSSTLTLTF